MASFDAFDRELQLATVDLEPEQISQALAVFARQELQKAQSAGASKVYDLYVNGRAAMSENEVVAPGPIIYEFALWEPVITFVLERLRQRAPSRSGRFRASFIVLADQVPVTNFDAIGGRAEIVITNFQPYVRKAETGQLSTKRFAIFDGAKRDAARRFGNEGRNTPAAFQFETKWLDIRAGVHPQMPYVLKREGSRKDRQKGMPITYPSVVMNMVF